MATAHRNGPAGDPYRVLGQYLSGYGSVSVYSLFQFVVQLALTVHYVAVVCDPTTPLSRSYSYIVDVMSLSSGVFLFCMRFAGF